MSDVFEAIATPVRRAILDELVERDGQTLFELCTRLTMKHQMALTRQAISQHLAVLESAGPLAKGRPGNDQHEHTHITPRPQNAKGGMPHENQGETGLRICGGNIFYNKQKK